MDDLMEQALEHLERALEAIQRADHGHEGLRAAQATLVKAYLDDIRWALDD